MKKQSKAKISASIPILFLRERNSFIVYTPSLDLSSFGKTLDEAKSNFSEAVQIFIEECFSSGTLNEVLESYGWVKRKKGWQPPVYIGDEILDVSSLAAFLP